MRTFVVVILSMAALCQSKNIDLEKDNKATEAKNGPIVVKEAEKSGKTEKRAPVVMTAVPGELKYESDYKYLLPDTRYQDYRPEVNYVSSDAQHLYGSQQPIATIAAPKTQFFIYPSTAPAHSPTASSIPQAAMPFSHIPQHTQMILMLAVPHPSGQYLMLLPATPQNFLYSPYHHQPMFYKPVIAAATPPTAPSAPAASSSHQLYHQQQQQIPSSSIYQASYSPQAHAQAAGFVAQQQLSYSGPYRSEKYSKQ